MSLTRRASLAGLVAGMTLTAPVVAMTQAQPSSAPAGGADPPDSGVRAFGAKGNRQDLDDAAFGRAIAAALAHDQYPSSIRVPAGHYRRARSIGLPNHAALRGEGLSSVLNSQNDTGFDAPILINRSPESAIGWRVSDLSLFGGSHGIKLDVSAEAANLRFDDVAMLMQSVANIEANKLFQTSKFFGGVLGSAPYGLKVNARTTNAFNSFGLEWTDHTKCSMYLRGAEGVLVVGGRFEGSGGADNATIDIEDGASITFVGVYFENVQEYLVRLRRVQVLSFVNCHFTGTNAGSPAGLAPFKWDIDAHLLTFRDCHSSVPMPLPGNVVMDGNNANIFPAHAVHEPHGLYGSITAAPRPLPAAGTTALLAAIKSIGGGSGDGSYRCELGLTVAEGSASPAMAQWQGRFDIVEQGGTPRIILSQETDILLGHTTFTLTLDAEGRLVARHRTPSPAGQAAAHLSWTIGWRRVFGGPISSLMLYVP